MDFMTAARSGRAFKRKDWTRYIVLNREGNLEWDNGDPAGDDLNKEWLDADDWETKEHEAVITYKQFWSTYQDIRNDLPMESGIFDVISELSYRLGIKP